MEYIQPFISTLEIHKSLNPKSLIRPCFFPKAWKCLIGPIYTPKAQMFSSFCLLKTGLEGLVLRLKSAGFVQSTSSVLPVASYDRLVNGEWSHLNNYNTATQSQISYLMAWRGRKRERRGLYTAIDLLIGVPYRSENKSSMARFITC